VGPQGHVIFSDISQDLLDHCRAVATAEGVAERCEFVSAPAGALGGIADGSVDAVTTRSVLIYVKDKATALREFHRVLRPGGRVSVFEPINVLMNVDDAGRFFGYDVRPVAALAAKVETLYQSIQPAGIDPMLDFDDRDLLRHAEQAGFAEAGIELRVTVKPTRRPCPWEQFLRMSGNPLIPALGEAMNATLTPDEITEFSDHLRPLVESGQSQDRRALAFLTAVKG
jgi:arsenite methyltransferase